MNMNEKMMSQSWFHLPGLLEPVCSKKLFFAISSFIYILVQCVMCVFEFQTPLNEALRYGFRNIVELLLKKGASLNMSEKSEDGTEVFPMDIAQKDVALLGRGGN